MHPIMFMPHVCNFMCGVPYATNAMCCLACDTVCDATLAQPVGCE